LAALRSRRIRAKRLSELLSVPLLPLERGDRCAEPVVRAVPRRWSHRGDRAIENRRSRACSGNCSQTSDSPDFWRRLHERRTAATRSRSCLGIDYSDLTPTGSCGIDERDPGRVVPVLSAPPHSRTMPSLGGLPSVWRGVSGAAKGSSATAFVDLHVQQQGQHERIRTQRARRPSIPNCKKTFCKR
jgi:hypothetical protein